MTQEKKLIIILYSSIIVAFFGALIHTLMQVFFIGKSMSAFSTYFFLNAVFVLIFLGLMNLDLWVDFKKQLSVKSAFVRSLSPALIFIVLYFSSFFSSNAAVSALSNMILIIYYIGFFVLIELCFFRVMEKFMKNNKQIFS